MKYLSEETKRKMSLSHKGKMPKNIELLKQLAHQRKGRPSTQTYLKDELSSSWKGDNIGYSALHKWITRKLGKASYCSINSNHRALRYEWSNISGEYRRDIEDFRSLCSSCHNRVDKGKISYERLNSQTTV